MTRHRHRLIVVALPFEGACFSRHLQLSPADSVLSMFANPPFHMVVSGVGKIRAAASTGALCARFSPEDIEAVINFGVAGSVSDLHPVGDLRLIHQIRDAATDRCYFPDMIASHQMTEACVTTVDQPATADAPHLPTDGLLDMEASGFYQAASMFVGPEKIICAKVVSDMVFRVEHRTALDRTEMQVRPRIDIATMSEALAHALPDVLAYVEAVCDCNRQSRQVPLTQTHRKYMNTLIEVLQLTRTQQAQLKESVTRFIHQYPDATLPEFIPARVTTARERNQYFAQFQKELLR